MTIQTAWYAWTEEPGDKLAKKLRDDRAAKKEALKAALAAQPGMALLLDAERAERLRGVLGFLGWSLGADNINTTEDAFMYPHRQAKTRDYCHPGELRTLPGVGGVRIYVLGPPHDEAKVRKVDPTAAQPETYVDSDEAFAFSTTSTADADSDQPFAARYRQPVPAALYQADPWRKLDTASLAEAERLALALDSYTNNTSLALAFELTGTREVLLFAADAQVGNWLSWHDDAMVWKVGTKKIVAKDLLARTTLYKVGHHGSHNATLKDLGLELMTSDDLLALIPVEVAVAAKQGKQGWKMPAEALARALHTHTHGRTVLSDPAAALPTLTPAEQNRFARRVQETELYVDVTV